MRKFVMEIWRRLFPVTEMTRNPNAARRVAERSGLIVVGGARFETLPRGCVPVPFDVLVGVRGSLWNTLNNISPNYPATIEMLKAQIATLDSILVDHDERQSK